MVPVGPGGILETFTRVAYAEPMHPRPAPFYYGIVKLDGADTGMAHMIDVPDGTEPAIGMRVKAVFKSERKGDILDIRHFIQE